MPRFPLLMTATLTGIPSMAQVASSWVVIWKQPPPRAAHPGVPVVGDGDLDRDPLDGAGGQLLVGHLEAAVAVDGPHGGLRPPVLGAHRGRDRVAHRAQPAAVEPGARLLVADELGGPHLVLTDAGGVDRVGAGDRAEPLDDVLRRQRAVLGFVAAQRAAGAPVVASLPPGGAARHAAGFVLGPER